MPDNSSPFSSLQNTHDLRLSDWGPYTKTYAGISHVADKARGLRFDLSLLPGFYRRKIGVPNVLWEGSFHPWQAAPDLSFFSYRHELEWKDQVFCDVSFARADEFQEGARLFHAECVNATALPQTLVLHLVASLNFPAPSAYSKERLRVASPQLPDGAVWVDALDYADFQRAIGRPTDHLVADGLKRGEVRGQEFVSGSGLKLGEEHDAVSWEFEAPHQHPVVVLRLRLPQGGSAILQCAGASTALLRLDGGESFQTRVLTLAPNVGGRHLLRLTSRTATPIEIDGFAVVPASQAGEVAFSIQTPNPAPQIARGPMENSAILEYQDAPCYGLAWRFDAGDGNSEIREFLTDELDVMMPHTAHNHVSAVFQGRGDGHFADVFLRPISLQAHQTRNISGLVCGGTREEVEAQLRRFDAQPDWQHAHHQARAALPDFHTPQGEPYAFSQERMAATTLTNIVFPVYVQRDYIRHSTPGRWWDSLYTWDSGFIGLGLCELDQARALDNLNAYMTEPGDDSCAFIHHGSPVPVQFYLFQELWNRGGNREFLEYFYPRLRQYHRFLSGNSDGSTTRNLASNLLRTWDYFYNSGGWDDYPPQVETHKRKLESSVTPCVNTAHAIRCAKILKMAALELGETQDIAEYDEQIQAFGDALKTHAWDEASGYFGYVQHDANGQPIGLLKHESGANFNMGLDGASPLVAGICTPAQEAALLAHLQNPEHLWSQIGLAAVDQSAPYYRSDGYWNGTVWMPHQWFMWKSLLDMNQPEFAREVARRGLEVWQREVEASYHCFEHFLIKTGRGAGWHQFSGLSTPVLSWFAAYFRPGHLTGGLDCFIKAQTWSDDFSQCEARLNIISERVASVVLCMAPDKNYEVRWNGAAAQIQHLLPGTLAVEVAGEGVLRVQPRSDTGH